MKMARKTHAGPLTWIFFAADPPFEVKRRSRTSELTQKKLNDTFDNRMFYSRVIKGYTSATSDNAIKQSRSTGGVSGHPLTYKLRHAESRHYKTEVRVRVTPALCRRSLAVARMKA